LGLIWGCSNGISDPPGTQTPQGGSASTPNAGQTSSGGSAAQSSGGAGSVGTGGSGGPSGGTGNGGTSSAGAGSGGNAGSSGGGGFDPGPCTQSAPTAQRLIRLTFDQVANSLKAYLGKDTLKDVTLPGITGNVRQRKFQALFTEGGFINTDVLTDTVNMTEGALGKLATPATFTAVTGCASPVTDACVQQFLPVFAEKAYRRPLSGTDQADVLAQYASYKTAGHSVEEAARYTLEAILISPSALYRTELGVTAATTAALTPFEMASELSYFLTNAPPDATLYAAAKAGTLVNDAVRAEVDRLLAQPETIENINQMMAAYYGLGEIDGTIKTAMFPEFVLGLKNSMYTETDTFLRKTLWQGKVTDLLTSKTSYINKTLADFYGVTYPGAAGSMTFEPFQFPDAQPRMGILTQGSVLAMRSRTDRTSVVARGLYVNSNILCQNTPPSPPPAVQQDVDMQLADLTSTERQKADFRDTNPRCMGCHLNFDQYGLALENYDPIGRYRAAYPNGTKIDASSTLPKGAGGNRVENVNDLALAVAGNGVFTRCLTSNLVKYALAEEVAVLTANDCAVREVHDKFSSSDQSFKSLMREIAISKALSVRAVGGP
jgi:hypothetical protein